MGLLAVHMTRGSVQLMQDGFSVLWSTKGVKASCVLAGLSDHLLAGGSSVLTAPVYAARLGS